MGGGLFATDGALVGLCATDDGDQHGLYLTSWPIRKILEAVANRSVEVPLNTEREEAILARAAKALNATVVPPAEPAPAPLEPDRAAPRRPHLMSQS